MDSSSRSLPGPDYRGTSVQLCSDGKYRWIYAMNMLTNPTVFLTVFKVFFFIVLGGWLVFGFFFHIIHGEFREFLAMGKVMLLVLAILAVLTFLAVLLLAAVYGEKYVVRISNKRHFKP